MDAWISGPWVLEEQWSGTAIKAPGRTVALVRPCADLNVERANARLLVSAPDLLAALERIVTGGCSAQAEEQARAAIAKARGEAPS